MPDPNAFLSHSSVLRYSIEQATKLGAGVWSAELSPSDARLLAGPDDDPIRVSGKSVIGVRGNLRTNDTLLSLDPKRVVVFAIGELHEAILINVGEGPKTVVSVERDQGDSADPDQRFLAECRRHFGVSEMSDLAYELLERIRRNANGHMEEAQNRKWVNRPDNFFTLTIQNRNQALRVSIRGRRESFKAGKIDLARGRNGYCEFIFSRREQLEEATRLILAASRASWRKSISAFTDDELL